MYVDCAWADYVNKTAPCVDVLCLGKAGSTLGGGLGYELTYGGPAGSGTSDVVRRGEAPILLAFD